jgi:HlyD family secretion protein
VVARIEPADPGLLDPRARAQAEHAIEAAEAAAKLARAERERAHADEDFAAAEVVRVRELHAKGVVSKQSIDEAERAHRSAAAALEAAAAAINVREHELAVARAALIAPKERAAGVDCACVDLHAPVSGEVLAIAEKSETVVQVGAPLLDVGDPARIEIVADYLSTDAVALKAGQRAVVDGWGGAPLNAVVRRVEPAAFTKVSALGIEEQRVNVVLDLTDPREQWFTLGHAYRVDVHVVVFENEAAVTVPLTALFRRNDGWALFLADDGVAQLRRIKAGQRAGLAVEILEGVVEGDAVVLNPGDDVEDGSRIRARERWR